MRNNKVYICPKCSGRLYYVLRSYEWWQVCNISDEGYVDTGEQETIEGDDTFDPYFECEDCYTHYYDELELKDSYMNYEQWKLNRELKNANLRNITSRDS